MSSASRKVDIDLEGMHSIGSERGRSSICELASSNRLKGKSLEQPPYSADQSIGYGQTILFLLLAKKLIASIYSTTL